MKPQLRSWLRRAHLWLGILVGLFLCLMGVTGGIVALRPQLAALLSPAAPNVGSCQEPDWNRAAREVTAYAHSEINRIYGPYGADTRYHFRMLTDRPNIYNHVIYDACAGRVLGSIDFGWMDWTVDLHHNLLAGRAGRQWAGAIGIAMLVSAAVCSSGCSPNRICAPLFALNPASLPGPLANFIAPSASSQPSSSRSKPSPACGSAFRKPCARCW
jgi:uncharacterized iron-regulated membrane protein